MLHLLCFKHRCLTITSGCWSFRMLALLSEESVSSDGLQVLVKLRCRVWVKKTGAEYWGQIQRWEEIMQMLSKRNCGALGSDSF